MQRKRKFDTIRFVNRSLDRATRAYGRAIAPRPQRKSRSFFEVFMDEITGAPRRRG
jgi:hypothetical protein